MKKWFVISLISLVLIVIICLFYSHYCLNNKQIPILLYHHFLSEEELKQYDNSDEYAVSVDIFDQQMSYLKENGYKSITLDELYCWKLSKCKIPEKAFVVVMDDGLTSVYRYARPILKKYGYTATLFTISSRINDVTPEWDPMIYQYIGFDIINSNDDIINIQSHSNNLHRTINNSKAVEIFNYDKINKDLNKSKKILNSKYLAYPFNTYNKNIFKALEKNGYLLAFRGTNKKTYKNEYKYMVSRIFVNNDMKRFKDIFETDKFNQNLFDKLKSDLTRIKKLVIK